MYKAVIGILGGISLSLIYYYILEIPKKFNKLWKIKLVKPFSCPFCMSFWFCFTYQLFNTQSNFIDCLFISTITPFLYLIIEDKFLTKWEF
jgi:hypothetical protein